ncbi:hypothetical protein BX070DRAFT_126024 [Coemansia spiralis]|nr:hypothetical protein BX070DRAFT_126024 [Coemansia spiralis]
MQMLTFSPLFRKDKSTGVVNGVSGTRYSRQATLAKSPRRLKRWLSMWKVDDAYEQQEKARYSNVHLPDHASKSNTASLRNGRSNNARGSRDYSKIGAGNAAKAVIKPIYPLSPHLLPVEASGGITGWPSNNDVVLSLLHYGFDKPAPSPTPAPAPPPSIDTHEFSSDGVFFPEGKAKSLDRSNIGYEIQKSNKISAKEKNSVKSQLPNRKRSLIYAMYCTAKSENSPVPTETAQAIAQPETPVHNMVASAGVQIGGNISLNGSQTKITPWHNSFPSLTTVENISATFVSCKSISSFLRSQDIETPETSNDRSQEDPAIVQVDEPERAGRSESVASAVHNLDESDPLSGSNPPDEMGCANGMTDLGSVVSSKNSSRSSLAEVPIIEAAAYRCSGRYAPRLSTIERAQDGRLRIRPSSIYMQLNGYEQPLLMQAETTPETDTSIGADAADGTGAAVSPEQLLAPLEVTIIENIQGYACNVDSGNESTTYHSPSQNAHKCDDLSSNICRKIETSSCQQRASLEDSPYLASKTTSGLHNNDYLATVVQNDSQQTQETDAVVDLGTIITPATSSVVYTDSDASTRSAAKENRVASLRFSSPPLVSARPLSAIITPPESPEKASTITENISLDSSELRNSASTMGKSPVVAKCKTGARKKHYSSDDCAVVLHEYKLTSYGEPQPGQLLAHLRQISTEKHKQNFDWSRDDMMVFSKDIRRSSHPPPLPPSVNQISDTRALPSLNLPQLQFNAHTNPKRTSFLFDGKCELTDVFNDKENNGYLKDGSNAIDDTDENMALADVIALSQATAASSPTDLAKTTADAEAKAGVEILSADNQLEELPVSEKPRWLATTLAKAAQLEALLHLHRKIKGTSTHTPGIRISNNSSRKTNSNTTATGKRRGRKGSDADCHRTTNVAAGAAIAGKGGAQKKLIRQRAKKAFRFNELVAVYETWDRDMYDRRGQPSTRLDAEQLELIKQELNDFKTYEMDVHEDSRNNTHIIC